MKNNIVLNYVPLPTVKKFHEAREMIRILLGPLGSGKSAGSCVDVFWQMIHVPVCRDNVRHSRWAFIRDSDANIRKTTVKTWLKWFPEDVQKNGMSGLTRVNWASPMSMRVNFELPDKTWVDAEVLCVYQSCEADAENLRSLELTGAYCNELNNIPQASFQMLRSRIRRFPSKDDIMPLPDGTVPEPRWCIIADSNMVPDDHWIYEMAEIRKPKGWAFFKQPPAFFYKGMDPKTGKHLYTPNMGQKIAQGIPPAENIDHLNGGWKYYTDQISGSDHDWVRVNLMAEYGTVKFGKPVYADYSDRIHYLGNRIPFDRTKTLFLGFDWGNTPSVAFGQLGSNGQAMAIDEVCGKDMCLEVLWETILRPKLVNEYGWGRGTQILAVGDPWGGGQRNQVTGNTCIQYLASQGLTVIPSRVKSPTELRAAVDYFIHRMAGKEPGMMLSDRVPTLRKGFCGWYFYKRIESHRDKVYQDEPAKNSYSHIQDGWSEVCHAMRFPDLYDVSSSNKATLYDQYGNQIDASGTVIPKKPSVNMAGLA